MWCHWYDITELGSSIKNLNWFDKFHWHYVNKGYSILLKWLCHLWLARANQYFSLQVRFLTVHGLTLIPTRISRHMSNKVWDEIAYPISNFNGCTVEVSKWIYNFVTHFIMDVFTFPCRNWSQPLITSGPAVELAAVYIILYHRHIFMCHLHLPLTNDSY